VNAGRQITGSGILNLTSVYRRLVKLAGFSCQIKLVELLLPILAMESRSVDINRFNIIVYVCLNICFFGFAM
jgi:hypothetical protein